MQLTPSQRSAIRHGGNNLQFIACAGSGKMEVLARRVVYLPDPTNANPPVPANIVAFTFTDKAAAELQERIVTRISDLPPAPVRRKCTACDCRGMCTTARET